VPNPLRVTVLGKSPSWQDVGGACSGYLVQERDTALLLDCGNGVFGKLRERLDYTDVDAVVLSHLHADHFLDLVPYANALTYGPRDARPILHAPPGSRDAFRRVCGTWGPEDLIEKAFDVSEYAVDDRLEVGGLGVRFTEVRHFTTTHAVEITGADGGRFTFGADTGPTDALPAFARGTDLLFVESTIAEPEPEGPRGHMTPREAGEHARAAGARRVVLTHISDEMDVEGAVRAAAAGFGGPVELAREGASYDV
jgi:ribonuclease BN (tRNA processing enzyme)